jgi:hypothetical protein
MKVVTRPSRHRRIASRPAPIAPASPQCSCSTISGRTIAAEAFADEVDLRLDRGEIALRAALQHEPPAEPRQVGRLRDIEKDVLRQHRREAGQHFLRQPAPPRHVGNLRLEEQHAAVAEDRHLACAEREVRELLDLVAEGAGNRLEEIAVAGRTLRVQPEVLHAAVAQHDDLDVLAADVDDDVRIGIELERRLRVRDGLDKRRVGLEHRLQDVLGVAGGHQAAHLEARAAGRNRVPQCAEDLHRVLDRVAA